MICGMGRMCVSKKLTDESHPKFDESHLFSSQFIVWSVDNSNNLLSYLKRVKGAICTLLMVWYIDNI